MLLSVSVAYTDEDIFLRQNPRKHRDLFGNIGDMVQEALQARYETGTLSAGLLLLCIVLLAGLFVYYPIIVSC